MLQSFSACAYSRELHQIFTFIIIRPYPIMLLKLPILFLSYGFFKCFVIAKNCLDPLCLKYTGWILNVPLEYLLNCEYFIKSCDYSTRVYQSFANFHNQACVHTAGRKPAVRVCALFIFPRLSLYAACLSTHVSRQTFKIHKFILHVINEVSVRFLQTISIVVNEGNIEPA